MTISDLFAAVKGLPLSAEVSIDFAGVTYAILEAHTSLGKLSLTASTAHTLAMIQAREANKASIKSLQSVSASLTAAQAQRDKLSARAVQGFIDKGLIHVPPHSPDEAALLHKIQQGDL